MIEFKIKGIDKVKNTFRILSPKKSKQLYGKALDIIAFKMQSFIKKEELTGQVLHVRTDNLRTSIVIIKTESDGMPARIVRAGGGIKDVKYAAIHEYGGIIRTKFATIKMPKRAYMKPAIDKFRPQFSKMVKEIINSELNKNVNAR